MTVAELIAELQKYPPEMPVVIENSEYLLYEEVSGAALQSIVRVPEPQDYPTFRKARGDNGTAITAVVIQT